MTTNQARNLKKLLRNVIISNLEAYHIIIRHTVVIVRNFHVRIESIIFIANNISCRLHPDVLPIMFLEIFELVAGVKN